MNIQKKKIAIFDLDGTLVESKQPMDEEMAGLVSGLLEKKMVAIISGGAFAMFEHQLPKLKCSPDLLRKLFFFPTTGTRFYRFTDKWDEVYSDEMTPEERNKIKSAFEKAFSDIGYKRPDRLYGEEIEDRGTQVTFSALGQNAPLDLKKKWRETQDVRPQIINALAKYLPDFEIKMPGVTSIDVTRKGIDKAYGIEQIRDRLGIPISEMIFVGDALYDGGNDHAVVKTGVDTIAVNNPEDTKNLLREWLKLLAI